MRVPQRVDARCTLRMQVDHGVIILQRRVAVQDGDQEDTLAERILEQEHLAYPEAIARVLSGKYECRDGRYVKTGSSSEHAKAVCV